MALFIQLGEVVIRIGLGMIGRLLKPMHGPGGISRDAVALQIHHPQGVLGRSIMLLAGEKEMIMGIAQILVFLRGNHLVLIGIPLFEFLFRKGFRGQA